MNIPSWYGNECKYTLYFSRKYGNKVCSYNCYMVDEKQAKYFCTRLKECNYITDAYYLEIDEEPTKGINYNKVDLYYVCSELQEEMYWVAEVKDGYIAEDDEGKYVSKYNCNIVDNLLYARKRNIRHNLEPSFFIFSIHSPTKKLTADCKFKLITVRYSPLDY